MTSLSGRHLLAHSVTQLCEQFLFIRFGEQSFDERGDALLKRGVCFTGCGAGKSGMNAGNSTISPEVDGCRTSTSPHKVRDISISI
jgi:hypothetical protein